MSVKSTRRHPAKTSCAVALEGELTIAGVSEFCDRAKTALEKCRDSIELDCSQVTYLDASALQALAALRLEARARGVEFLVRGVSVSVLESAKLLGMAGILAEASQNDEVREHG